MRNGLLLLGGVCVLTSSIVAQAAQTTKVLKTYVGEYELRADWILTATLENGSLWGQPTNQEKRQIFPESQAKFFLKDLPVTFEFQKDPKGNVTGVHMVQEGRGERDLRRSSSAFHPFEPPYS